MPESFVSAIERPDIALSNALRGNLEGAGLALFSPDSLSPDERQTLHERWFGTNGDESGVSRILQYTTNPFIIAGAILTLRYPIRTSPGNLPEHLRSDAYLTGKLRRFLPLYDHLGSFVEVYKGTPLPELLQELGTRTHVVQQTGTRILADAFERFYESSGHTLTSTEGRAAWDRVVGVLDGTTSDPSALQEVLEASYKDSPEKLAKVRSLIQDARRSAITYDTLTPAEKILHDGVRDFYDYHWEVAGNEVPGTVEALKRKVASRSFEGAGVPGVARENYWRHLTLKTREEARAKTRDYLNAMLEGGERMHTASIWGKDAAKMTPSEYRDMLDWLEHNYADADARTLLKAQTQYVKDWVEANKGLKGRAARVASNSKLARFNKMVADPEWMKRLGGPWSELGELADKATFTLPGGREVKAVSRYRMDLSVTQLYNHESALDYGWSVIPHGAEKSIGQRIREVGTDLGRVDPVRRNILRDTILPGVMQQSSYDDLMYSGLMQNMRLESLKVLESEGVKKWVPAAVRKQLTESLIEAPTLGSSRMGTQLAGLFYNSTLSLPNFVAPMKNLAQTFLTTYPVLGAEYTYKGMAESVKRYWDYAQLRMGGHGMEEAASKAFAGFHTSSLEFDEGLREIFNMMEDPIKRSGALGKRGLKEGYRRLSGILMSAFMHTERFNRMTAFFGARQRVLDEMKGAVVPDIMGGSPIQLEKEFTRAALDNPAGTTNNLVRYATRQAELIVQETQFGGGVINSPMLTSKLPTLAKMLTNFPLRFASFVSRGGLGRLGRIALGTGGVIALGSMLKGDEGERLAESATLTGALPIPDENAMFAPWPLVPPAIQLGGAITQAALFGDTENLRRSTPLLVPGGVGLARIAGTQSETVGKFIGKPWADYKNALPDGRVPLNTPDGNLIGYYTPTQLWARSFGIGDLNGTQDRALTQWMLKHRDRVSEVRRKYLDALADNDQRAADRVEAEYQKMYPGMGPIPVKKSHIRALHLRRDVARVERVLENMPEEVRQQFAAATSVALANRGPSLLGLEGDGLASGRTVRERDPYRVRSSPLYGEGPSDVARRGQVAESRLLEGSFLSSQGL